MDGDLDERDDVSRRLAALADDLERQLAGFAEVEREGDGGQDVALTPKRAGALGISWIDWGLSLQVETAGGLGGRWELGRESEDAAFLEYLVRAVVAGRVVEIRAGDRSRVEVTLADGSVAAETGSKGLMSLLPKPGWKRRGERIQYVAYRE